MIRILYESIEDPITQDGFQKVQEFINDLDLLKPDFIFQTYTFTAAVTALRIRHPLGRVPRDIIQTATSNGMIVTWHFDNFTREELVVTTTGPGTVRLFLGAYIGGNNV